MRGPSQGSAAPTGRPAAAQLRASAGAFVRPLQRLVRCLLNGPHTIPELVAASGAPRREVEQVVQALAPDLLSTEGQHVLRDGVRADYADVLAVDDLDARPLDDVVGGRLAARADLVAFMAGVAGSRPRPERDLDHVAATPQTVVRRALWLDAMFDLTRTEVLCVGDHDLTSLGIVACTPGARVTVVDIDDRILKFIDGIARDHGWQVRCLWGDFRLGLPASAQAVAGLAVTDPPYTPQGVATFLLAALRGLGDTERGRVVLAYGYGDHQPSLGLKVQQAILEMHVAFEAILPGFNQYDGAQAIGSRSDLYVCRPTARTWRALPAMAEREAMRIYTHGGQSLESVGGEDTHAVLTQALAQGPPSDGRVLLVGDAWPSSPRTASAQRTSVATVLARGLPKHLGTGQDVQVLVDQSQAPSAWLPRVLLALNVGWLGAVVPAGSWSPDDTDLLRDKYVIGAHPLPSDRFELVIATPASDGSSPVVRDVLRKAHGRLGNAWREALIDDARRRGTTLTKNQARSVVEAFSDLAGLPELRLVEAPRHLLEAAVARIRASSLASSVGSTG